MFLGSWKPEWGKGGEGILAVRLGEGQRGVGLYFNKNKNILRGQAINIFTYSSPPSVDICKYLPQFKGR